MTAKAGSRIYITLALVDAGLLIPSKWCGLAHVASSADALFSSLEIAPAIRNRLDQVRAPKLDDCRSESSFFLGTRRTPFLALPASGNAVAPIHHRQGYNLAIASNRRDENSGC